MKGKEFRVKMEAVSFGQIDYGFAEKREKNQTFF